MRALSLRSPLLVFSGLLGLLAATRFAGDPLGAAGMAVLFVMALAPGAALYLIFERQPRLLELLLATFALSPVLVATEASVLLLAGLSPDLTGDVLMVGTIVLWLVLVAVRTRPYHTALSNRQWLTLAGTLLVLCAIVGYLPLVKSYWRYGSDAWFHHAVVAQIDAFGLPPTDPYFAGLDLQYMWAYHVLVLTLSKASRIDPSFVMTLINVQSLCALVLATFATSIVLRRRFAYGWFAAITVVFGLSALLWAFLPVKLIRALTGTVTGWEEVKRTYSLVPFDDVRIRAFFTLADNPTFMLDKFIVATAFGLGMALLVAAVWGILVALSTRRPFAYVTVGAAIFGALLFHTVVGVVTIGATLCGLIALWLRRSDGPHRAAIPRLAAAIITAGLLAVPYVYIISHLKDSEFLIPISFTWVKVSSIAITCALVAVLALFQLRRLATSPSPPERFMFFATVAMALISVLLDLHGASTNHKMPFFIFLMLAIVGSWTFAERFDRRHASTRYRRSILIAAFALLLPVNVISLIAYYYSPHVALLTPEETAVGSWAREATSRDALFFDSDDRVFMLVAGPRQYYWGRTSYAQQFGYPRDEMRKRRQVRDNLYSADPIARETLSALGSLPHDAYLIARDGENPDEARFERHGDLFSQVFATGGMSVWKVDRDACRRKLDHAGR